MLRACGALVCRQRYELQVLGQSGEAAGGEAGHREGRTSEGDEQPLVGGEALHVRLALVVDGEGAHLQGG